MNKRLKYFIILLFVSLLSCSLSIVKNSNKQHHAVKVYRHSAYFQICLEEFNETLKSYKRSIEFLRNGLVYGDLGKKYIPDTKNNNGESLIVMRNDVPGFFIVDISLDRSIYLVFRNGDFHFEGFVINLNDIKYYGFDDAVIEAISGPYVNNKVIYINRLEYKSDYKTLLKFENKVELSKNSLQLHIKNILEFNNSKNPDTIRVALFNFAYMIQESLIFFKTTDKVQDILNGNDTIFNREENYLYSKWSSLSDKFYFGDREEVLDNLSLLLLPSTKE